MGESGRSSRTCSTVAGERRRIVEAGKPRAGRSRHVGGRSLRRNRRSRAGLKFRGKTGLIGGWGLSLALRVRAAETVSDDERGGLTWRRPAN